MKPYLLSLAAGLLVGAIYALLNVRSPAPPGVALLGLLGILIGEQAVLHARPRSVVPAATANAAPEPIGDNRS
jgi:XapX domain-containing protein